MLNCRPVGSITAAERSVVGSLKVLDDVYASWLQAGPEFLN